LDHRFIWFLCQKYAKLPDDDWFEKIDPMVWLWMYMSWIEDQNGRHKFARDYSVFVGSFSNPEAGKKMRDAEDPDYASSDDDFEESWKRVEADRDKVISGTEKVKKENEGKLRHRRRGNKKVIR
jgi:hypothetical protein